MNFEYCAVVMFTFLFVNCCLQIVATKKYVCSVFYVVTRLLLTKHLHEGYFTDIVYYTINTLDEAIDNP